MDTSRSDIEVVEVCARDKQESPGSSVAQEANLIPESCTSEEMEAFRSTLTDALPLGCKYCCKPEARFFKRLDMKSHIIQDHPGHKIIFITLRK